MRRVRTACRGAAALALWLALGAGLAGAESAVCFATPAEGQAASEAVGALSALSGGDWRCDLDLLAERGSRPLVLHLVNASPAEQLQAIAHALGCWWTRDASGAVIFTAASRLPQGRLRYQWTTSGLRDQRALEPLVDRLLAPWLGGDAGLAYQPGDGLWPGTLDDAGHARLVEALSTIELSQPRCPDLVPDPDQPDLEATVTVPIPGGTWGETARELSAVARVSVALGPGLQPGAAGPSLIPPGDLREVLAQLEHAGARAAFRHGVLCLDAQTIVEREHPASRRRLALLPIGHLLRSELDGELVATSLERAVAPESWNQPGWALAYIAPTRSLLVAADVATIHAVLDALDRLDVLGLEDGLASLAPPDARSGR
jgi:hypothetical protein